MRHSLFGILAAVTSIAGSTITPGTPIDPTRELAEAKVKPGISVLITDSLGLIKKKRLGILTNQAGVNERVVSSIDLIHSATQDTGRMAGKVVAIFAPEHGYRADQDKQNVPGGVDKE